MSSADKEYNSNTNATDNDLVDESSQRSSPPLVRVRLPKLVLFGFHGTIAPVDWEDQCIFPYLKDNLLHFIELNWNRSDEVVVLIEQLRQQSFDTHFVYENIEAPLIISLDGTNSNWKEVCYSVYQFVMWQTTKSHMSKESICLSRLCWTQGYQDKMIKTIIFDDVLQTVRRIHETQAQVGIFSTMNRDTCKLVLSSTTAGNLTNELDYFFDQDSIGSRRDGASYEKIAAITNLAKEDILFICDYGQDVKIATQNGLQAVIIQRAGNRPNRDYYLIRFPNTTLLDKIVFN